MTAEISVLMPAYNALPYIKEAVESVLAQGDVNWELVISDNGSTDGTLEYYDTLRDKRIRIYRQRENLGVYGNLNFLLPQARAPIAKLLCADDVLLPGSLSSTFKFMESRSWCALSRCYASGDFEFFSPSGVAHLHGSLPTEMSPAAAVLAYATFGNIVGNLTKAACRPAMVLEIGGFNAEFTYAGDMEGWLRVVSNFGIALQNEELVFERSHPLQNRVLLNSTYASFSQINKVVELMSGLVSPGDLPLLRQHWRTHFFSPRVSPTVREIARGNIGLAKKIWEGLPLGFSVAACIACYPAWKMGGKISNWTTVRLLGRISQLNNARVEN